MIRTLRTRPGYFREELGAMAGLHRTYIGTVERGEKNVTLFNACRIAMSMGKTLYELLEGVECPLPDRQGSVTALTRDSRI
jgi:DNA-binding XRE family transcriptional regulator